MNAYFSRNWALALLAGGGLLALGAARPRPVDESILQRLARQVSEYYATVLPEKAYLHLDKPVYATGETIWFSAYVVDGLRHQADSLSKVLYVDLVSPEQKIVAQRTLRLQGGRAYGDLDVADTLAAGTYQLRAYTNWMRNAGDDFVYSRRLQVWAASPYTANTPPPLPVRRPAAGTPVLPAGRPDVQFFPEGGALVAGLPAVVALKAVDVNGRGIDIKAQIIDDRNAVVVPPFGTTHLGMGHFALTPAAGQHYRARVALPGGTTADYALPAVQASGYSLHVIDAGADYTVEARYQGPAGSPAPAGPVMLLTEVRGFLVYMAPRPVSTAPATWKVAKARYPSGILHLTLVDAQGTPQAERLAFVQNGPATLPAALTPDKTSAYGLRAPVQVKVRVVDAAGQPLAATRLSVSVVETALANLDPTAETIASNLLLTSDLAGYVEGPGYYFQNPTAETARALDDLLLTQGWRRFVWKSVVSGQAPYLEYPADQALALGGQVLSEHGYRPIPNSQLTFVETRPIRQVTTGVTNAAGRFRFVGFDGRDTAIVTLQARRAQGGSNVVIRPDAGPSVENLRLPPLPTPPAPIADFVKRSRQQQADEHEMDPSRHPAGMVARNILLDNVAVTAKRVAVPPDDPRRLYGATGGTVIDFASTPAAQSGLSVFQVLQGRVAGLTISGTPPNMSIQIRNQGTPQFILDGARVDADVINTLVSSDIQSVEVFKGNEAAIFGGSGGVIAIYTKRADPKYKGADKGPAPGIATVKLPGYYQAREFYAPRYGAPTLTAPGPDPRRTSLYWNPTVRTNAAGEAALTFFTGDVSGTFRAIAEGITATGQPVRGTATVTVQGK